jgi:hypothetical protein
MTAVTYAHLAIVQFLLDQGANKDAVNEVSSRGVFKLAESAGRLLLYWDRPLQMSC